MKGKIARDVCTNNVNDRVHEDCSKNHDEETAIYIDFLAI